MKVTVITVCYNAGALLEPTMQSVLAQDWPDLEYIVIDGGSTDGSRQVIERHAARLAYWSSEPDGGIYDAMNKGLSHATGRWVNFMNAGDAFASSTTISDVFGNAAITEGVRLVGGNTINVYADHEETHHGEAADALRSRLPFSHQASFARIGDADFAWKFDTSLRYAADYDLFARIYWTFGREAIVTLDLDMARYRQVGSVSLVNMRRTQREYLRIRSRHRDGRWWRDCLRWLLHR